MEMSSQLKSNVAFLMYHPLKQRQKNNSFEGNYNIGANVIIDVLKRNNIECDFCTVDTADKYKIVLVSFTSDFDCISFYQSVALLPTWQPTKRSFCVIGGGEGMQNPTVIRNYVDYGVFGRAENIIVDLVDCVLGGKLFEHESVMNLPELHDVKVAQARDLYPYEIKLGGEKKKTWNESFIGCPNKCLFCHYSWSRKWIGGDTYHQGDLTLRRSSEILWKDIQAITSKEGRIRSAIDGSSERLRMAYGKKITNKEVIDGIDHLGSFDGITVLMVYNISNMPHETQKDRDELYGIVKQANPKNRVIVVFQSTPFRASLLTPLMFAPVRLFPCTSDLRAQAIYDSDNLRVMHSFSNEGAYSQLQTMIVNRATPETDKLFHTICFHPKMRNGTARKRVKRLESSFDLSQYLKEYGVEEKHPAWFLSSYASRGILKSTYLKAEAKLGYL